MGSPAPRRTCPTEGEMEVQTPTTERATPEEMLTIVRDWLGGCPAAAPEANTDVVAAMLLKLVIERVEADA